MEVEHSLVTQEDRRVLNETIQYFKNRGYSGQFSVKESADDFAHKGGMVGISFTLTLAGKD